MFKNLLNKFYDNEQNLIDNGSKKYILNIKLIN